MHLLWRRTETHVCVPYPMWTCKQWGHWGWAQSRRRRDSGSCRVCWYNVGNRGRWLCTHLYPHMSSHHASAGNQDDTCTEGAKSTGDVSKSHSLRIWPLFTFSLDRLQRRASVSQSALNRPQTCALYLHQKLYFCSLSEKEIQLLLSKVLRK